MNQVPPNPLPSRRIVKAAEVILLLLATIFLALHALHLNADFPNHSPWMDWAKYTDEGWYGDGAIRHFLRGQWNVPGDFNPAAALPVWPLLEAALFRFTGVHLAAARALTVGIFGLILASSYLLLRRWANPAAALLPGSGMLVSPRLPSLAPAIAILLLAVSPFCYAFTRLAILEPLLILFTLLAMLTASYVEPGKRRSPSSPVNSSPANSSPVNELRRAVPLVVLGLLLTLMVLTKTTALFLFPAIGWLLWARAGYSLRPFVRLSFPPAILAAALWFSYYVLLIHPYFLLDYRYLFDANAYTGITVATALSVLRDTLRDGLWIGKLLYPFAGLAAAVAVLSGRRLLRNPLIPALLLWAVGYAAFLAYHNNLQPRYYLVLAIPLTLLIPIVFQTLWFRIKVHTPTPVRHLVVATAAAIVAVVTVTDARQTLHYVRTPDYTFTNAAAQIHRIIAADHTHNPLILSISGSNLSLMTGLPSICDDFGTMDLAVRVRAYRPGWYVAWNHVEDDKMDALNPMYRLRRVAAFPAMDDPERNLLILYRLDPAAVPPVQRRYRKPAVPHLLQTSLGHQPTTTQLEH